MHERATLLVVFMLTGLVLAACGEPAVELAPPEREDGRYLHDEVGVVDGAVEGRLSALRAATGFDVVALVHEDDRASLGQADRAGHVMLTDWDADIVLVAVGFPGDFVETDPDARRRYFGITATDRFTVDRDLRERIVEDAVPGPAGDNDWTAAFMAAVDVLEDELAARKG